MSWTRKNLSWTDRHLNWTAFLTVLCSSILFGLFGAVISYLAGTFFGFVIFTWYLQKKMRSLFYLLLVPIPFGILGLLSLENLNVALVLGDYEDEEGDDSGDQNYTG